jgi:hypothetical protein
MSASVSPFNISTSFADCRLHSFGFYVLCARVVTVQSSDSIYCVPAFAAERGKSRIMPNSGKGVQDFVKSSSTGRSVGAACSIKPK